MGRVRLTLVIVVLLVAAAVAGRRISAENRFAARIPADLRHYVAGELEGLAQFQYVGYSVDGDVAYVAVQRGPHPVTGMTDYHLFKAQKVEGTWQSKWTMFSRQEAAFDRLDNGPAPWVPGTYWPAFDGDNHPTMAYGGGAVFDPKVVTVIGLDKTGRVATARMFGNFFWMETDLAGDLAEHLWKRIQALDANGNVLYEGQPQYPENVVPMEFWLPRPGPPGQ